MTVGESLYTVRAYRDADERGAVGLLRESLGGGTDGVRAADLFRWKHLENPFGRSLMIVAEDGERIIGLRAFMRWGFRAGDRRVEAVRAVDTATHPEYQRKGVFSRLTRAALEELEGKADLVFNTPNQRSLPGYLKMGWRVVGRFPVSVRIRRPLRVASALVRSAPMRDAVPGAPPSEAMTAARALEDPRVPELLDQVGAAPGRLATARDVEYLRWRYGSAPGLEYRAVVVEGGQELRGLAVFRLRRRRGRWEAAVAELLTPAGDREAALRLLRRVVRAAPVDYLISSFPAGSPAAGAARRAGFLRSPMGPTFVVNPLRDPLEPPVTDRRSWWLSLGDLEVF